MNLFVHPMKGFRVLCEDTELSMARITVVPTAHTRLPASLALFTTWQAS